MFCKAIDSGANRLKYVVTDDSYEPSILETVETPKFMAMGKRIIYDI